MSRASCGTAPVRTLVTLFILAPSGLVMVAPAAAKVNVVAVEEDWSLS